MASTQGRSIAQARDELATHPLYRELQTPEDVRIFMEHHVFAVWDFFTLLKRLQREVTCIETPWIPRPYAEHGRFVMDIVLNEETDENYGGGHISHFELYRNAMSELGADRTVIDRYVDAVGAGADPLAALAAEDVGDAVEEFVGHTLRVALHGKPHEVAASFCHGRENLLPDVLTELRDGLGDTVDEAPIFRHYLERHIQLDHDEHGPLALRLLGALCDGDAEREAEATKVGLEAIESRARLWDGIVSAIKDRR